MRTFFAGLVLLFLVIVAAVHGFWIWAGWTVTVDGVHVSIWVPITVVALSSVLALGILIEQQVRTRMTAVPTTAEPSREIRRVPSPKFAVRQGKRYKAQISLSFFEQMASNEMIAGMFQKAGFTEVTVTGSGAIRYAEGRWAGTDATAEMPPQIVSATEIAEAPIPPSAGTPA